MFFKCKEKIYFCFQMKNEPRCVLKYLDFIFVNDDFIIIENRKKKKLHKKEKKKQSVLKMDCFFIGIILFDMLKV
ncbi:hypothetical protein CN554_20105 [Bacillus wiedmannii]|nr:hypothetical protein CN554_20105 [Bacillus wiedmannii]